MQEKVAASVSSLLFLHRLSGFVLHVFFLNHDGNGWKWMAMATGMVMDGDGDGMHPSPRRSALMWLDLRLPFTEIVGSVLKAAQAQY
jgi:hypothetical protein